MNLLTDPDAKIAEPTSLHGYRVLIVDDELGNRRLCRLALESQDVTCDEAADGEQALVAVTRAIYDLMLLDIDMPRLNGREVLRRLRTQPPYANLKVMMLSGRASGDEMAQLMLAGADDYLAKPFSVMQLGARVRAALRLKRAQDRAGLMNQHLLAMNRDMELSLQSRDCDLLNARNTLVLALAELVSIRDAETGAHLRRLQSYCRVLAEQALAINVYAGQIDEPFLQMLECCAPLHDIGKVGVPDHILRKPGPLDAEERRIMETHTVQGADILQKAAREHGFQAAFMQMASDIARHHHERFDGNGYPDRLAGEDIPLAARMLAVGDVYDALRSRRVYKPALPHDEVLSMMTRSPGHFDPALLAAFERCADRFEQVFRELAD